MVHCERCICHVLLPIFSAVGIMSLLDINLHVLLVVGCVMGPDDLVNSWGSMLYEMLSLDQNVSLHIYDIFKLIFMLKSDFSICCNSPGYCPWLHSLSALWACDVVTGKFISCITVSVSGPCEGWPSRSSQRSWLWIIRGYVPIFCWASIYLRLVFPFLS